MESFFSKLDSHMNYVKDIFWYGQLIYIAYLFIYFQKLNNSTIKKVTFAAVINVHDILIWQTVFLVVFYIVIYRYDKYMQENKKK